MKNNYQRNIIDRFERNRQRQKIMYESYDSKLKHSNFSLENKKKRKFWSINRKKK